MAVPAHRLVLALVLAWAVGCGRPGSMGPAGDRRTNDGAPPAAAPSAAAPPAPQRVEAPSDADPAEAREARERLVRDIQAHGDSWGGPWDPRVIDALRRVPRHQFAPGLTLRQAYDDRPQPIGHGQTISQPTIVAIMSSALKLTGAERVLEIGTGSGYQAAILSLLCREVRTIEIVAPLGETARDRLAALGYRNVLVRIGDGYRGWPEAAPFDRVLITAAPPEVPQALVDQLAEGGILVAPVGEDGEAQRLIRWTKRGGALHKEDLGAVRFVPMVPGAR